MRISKIVVMMACVCYGPLACAYAQVAESSSVPSAMEQWQLSLDVIKAKTRALLVRNNRLQSQFQQLSAEAGNLQKTIAEQQTHNEAQQRFLQQRHGRTDQQVRLEALEEAIKVKRLKTIAAQGQLLDIKKQKIELDRKLHLQQLKLSSLQKQQSLWKGQGQKHTDETPDPSLMALRQKLENTKKQEVLLDDELASLKSGHASGAGLQAIESQNRQLQGQLDDLRRQMQARQPAGANSAARANQAKYEQLKKRKIDLEAKINAYEARLDQLQDPSQLEVSWRSQKKGLIHSMVQVDAHNNQLRGNIKTLKEDVQILADQVAKLEHQMATGQGGKTPQK